MCASITRPLRVQWRPGRSDHAGWRTFVIAIVRAGRGAVLALYSSAAAEDGRHLGWPAFLRCALALAGWVAFTMVPVLARRTPLRWLAYHIDYRVTREGIVYLAASSSWRWPRSTPATICCS